MAARGVPMDVAAHLQKNPLFYHHMVELRDRFGLTVIVKNEAFRLVPRALAAGRVVALVSDQNMRRRGIFVDFFGKKASTMPALAVLAARTGASVLPTYTYRDRDLIHHHCVVLPEIQIDREHKDSRDSIVQNTQKFTGALESIADQHPDQWLWIHKRWRTRPKGEKVSPLTY